MKRIKFVCLLFLLIISFSFILSSCHSCTWGEWVVDKDATCTEDGLEVRKCECGETEERPIPAKGHDFGEWEVTKESTCKEEGVEERKCSCGEVEQRSLSLNKHNFGEWKVILDATCTEEGIESRYCECGFTESRPIEAGHKVELTLSEDQTYYIVSGKGCDHGIIPTEYEGKPVKAIGTDAFRNSTLTEISIPEGITSIGDYAFYNTKLESITLPSTLTDIGYFSFGYSRKLSNITLPVNVKTIGKNAFYCCSGLTSINIHNNVESIDENAFDGCISLSKVEINDLVSWMKIDFKNDYSNPLAIAKYLYLNGEELVDISIPEEISNIKKITFLNCLSVKNIVIPNSVECIEEDAFYGCINLSKVTINDIASWCNIEFKNEYSNPLSLANDLYVGDQLTNNVVIPEGVTSICKYAFINYENMSSIKIPSSLTSIGVDAFYGCTNLSKLYINDIALWCNIEFANDYANPLSSDKYSYVYLNDEPIKDLIIPEQVTNIPNYAFYKCASLESISIPSTVETIGTFAFTQCLYVETIEIASGVKEIGEEAFYGCNKVKYLTIPDGVTSIGKNAFAACTGLYSVNIPFVGEKLDGSGDKTFKFVFGEYHQSVSMVWVTGGEVIGKEAFSSLYNIKEIHLSNTVTTIENNAFYYCYNLTTISIPSSVTTIGTDILSGCSKLISIDIPFVGSRADGTGPTHFGYLFGARSYYYNSSSVPTSLKYVDVIAGTKIPDYAFYECNRLTRVELPNTLTEIGNYAFYSCLYMTDIQIPTNVKAIGKYAFGSCGALKSIYFKYTYGWYRTTSYNSTYGTSMTVTNISTNAENLVYNYREQYWYNSEKK